MCELLGLAFNRPVSPGLSFRGFRHRGRRNPDGWGLAAIEAKKTTIVKEPISAEESDTAAMLPDRDSLHAPIFIGHVRAASCGSVSPANTHPFTRAFGGTTFTFAHNGTLDAGRLEKKVGPDFTPEGQTDSELAMGALLTWLHRGQGAGCLSDYTSIEEFLRDLNNLGNLNLLFSDGQRLYCYHDAGAYNGLAWTRRESPFCRVSLRDEDWEADLAEEKEPDQRGYVLASRPLTDGEGWTKCRPGRLLVIERGTAVFGA
jgi:predicted glutamine amidotransferase